MIKKIKTWLYSKRAVRDGGITPCISNNVIQQDTRSHEAIKRVRKAFEQQSEVMHIRSLKRHGSTCKNPDLCTKKICFKWEPDKIVSEPYKVDGKESKKENEYYRDQKYRKFTDEELNYILKGHYQKLFEEKREKHPNVVAAAHAEKIAK